MIAHGMWRERGEEIALDAQAREILTAIVRDGIGYQPTTQVIVGELEASSRGTITRAAEVTRVLADADARLLFGSDTPSDLLYTNPPGLNGRLEMNNWITAGVSKKKLFHALTIDSARMLPDPARRAFGAQCASAETLRVLR